MVLHLLGHKSWNVYNRDNIERVRRDEADAQAREEAAEQRMQEEDAQRRIALLRGEKVAPLPDEAEPTEIPEDGRRRRKDDETYSIRDRKRRRLRGEDDTDRDIRYARQDTEAGQKATQSLMKNRDRDAPLQDHAGNIQLFAAPDEKAIRATQKNEEAEAEKAAKRKREEDQVTMRFSNAAGYQNGMQKPWYAAEAAQPSQQSSRNELMLAELKGKDVWGNEDPSRKEREQNRISSSDPFAAMQQAQRQLKQSNKDKEKWQRQQQQQLEELKRQQKREKGRRRRDDDVDSIESFSLDAPAEKVRDHERDRGRDHGERRQRHRHHHRSSHRSRSKERERRQRHRSRSRSQERDRHRHSSHKSRPRHEDR